MSLNIINNPLKLMYNNFGIIIGLLNCIIASLFWSKDIRKNVSIKNFWEQVKRIYFLIYYTNYLLYI